MKYVCFAASPLHLMCIKELALLHEEDYFVTYCLVQDRHDALYEQIIRTIELLDLDNVREVVLPKIKVFHIVRKFMFAYSLFYKYKSQPTTFVILDFRNTFMHFLRRLFPDSRFILIDDGFATYEAYHNYIKDGYFLPYLQYRGVLGSVNKFINFGSDFSHLLHKEIDLFTIYARELGLSADSYNALSFVRKLSEAAMLSYSDTLVYFAGSRMAEKDVLTMDEEIRLIVKVNDYWAEKGKKMIYVGKRVARGTPSENKMKRIEEKSIPVVFFDLPLELALIDAKPKMIPTTICSFGSTLSTTLPMLHPNIDAYLVEIKDVKDTRIEVKNSLL
jgi:hypothetical protein